MREWPRRAKGIPTQGVAQRVIGLGVAVVVRHSRDVAHEVAAAGVLDDAGLHGPHRAGDVHRPGHVPAVRVARSVGDGGRGPGRVQGPNLQRGVVDPCLDHAGVLRGCRVAERVVVRVLENPRDVTGAQTVSELVPLEREVGDERGRQVRRRIGRALSGVRPRPLALKARERAHLRLVGRARLEARQVDAGRRGGQLAGLLVVGVGDGVVGPRRGRLAVGGLLAVLDVVARDGRAGVARSRPRHVERRVGRLAELRAGERGRVGLPGLDVRHLDEDVDGGGVAVDGVVHLGPVELRDHLAVVRLRLAVRVVCLVVDRRAGRHADLAAGRVDDEQPGVLGLARQRVAQRVIGLRVAVVVRRPGHGGTDVRPGGGVLGDAARGLRGDGDVRAARDLPAVGVARDVVDLRGALVEQGHPEMGLTGSAGQADPEQRRVLGRGRVGQGVAVGVGEEHTHRALPGLLVVGDGANGERAAAEGGARGGRRAVSGALAGVGPRPLALLAADGPDLRLVGGARLEVGEVERRGGRAERAGVSRPRGGFLALGGLLAVLRLVAGDGQVVRVGRRPRHVERRVRGLAERGARHLRRGGLGGVDVRHLDENLDGGVVAVDGVGHLAAVELAEHRARVGRPVLDLPMRVVRLVVDRRAGRHADLAGRRVDGEEARVLGLARQRVGQRDAVVRRPRHGSADGRAGRRVLGDAPRGLRGDADSYGAGD